jgi:CRP-like cAMP-binding protein
MSQWSSVAAARSANRLFVALPDDAWNHLAPKLEIVPLTVRQELIEAGRPFHHVYFMLTGVTSLVSALEDGSIIEVATVGNEGMVGLAAFLGTATLPLTAFVQVPGEALRLSVAALAEETRGGGPLNDALRLYTQALLNQIAQSAACNRIHAIEERCARWLLMTHDRVTADEFPLTQEFLSQMLGVRRAGVSVAAGMLQKAGLIAYQRGKIRIIDRVGLEEASCECYELIRREYDRLLPKGDTGREAAAE